MWDWLAGLDLEKAANAIVILVTGLAVGLGFRRGKQAPHEGKPPPSSVVLEGALVDSSSIKQAAIELSGLSSSVADLVIAVGNGKEELEEHRHSLNRVREALDRLTMETARRR